MGAVMTWMSSSARATPAAAQMPSRRRRTTCRASSAAKSRTRPALRHGEAAQAGDAGGDRDGDVEGEERLAALGLAADDADGLLGPQAGDQPALLLGALGEAPCGLDRQQAHRRRPRRLGLGDRRRGAGLEEQLLVDLAGLALGGDGEQLAGDGHQRTRIALGVIGEGGDQLGRHQLDGAGLVQGVLQQLVQLLGRGAFEREAHAHAAGERQQLLGAQAFEQAAVAGEHDGQQDMAVETRRGQQAQLGEHGGRHLLGLVDDQHGPRQRGVDVGLPALAQHLGAGPAVVRAQLDAEQVAHLAIEVGEAGLGPADDADLDVALLAEALGENAQGDGLAGAGRAGDEGEAAFADELLDAPAERLDAPC